MRSLICKKTINPALVFRANKKEICVFGDLFSHKKPKKLKPFFSLSDSLPRFSLNLFPHYCCCWERLLDAAAAAARLGTPHLPARGATRLGASSGAFPPLLLPFFAPPSPSDGISHGSAAAELVSRSSVTNARIGDRSIVPPSGGMRPRKRPR